MAEGTGDTGQTQTDTGSASLPPGFSEPASGRLTIPVTRTRDVRLAVVGVELATTEVIIDGISLGDLLNPVGSGQLTADQLLLRIRGALIPGDHTLQLRNASPAGPLESASIDVFLEDQAAPSLEVVATEIMMPGQHVLAQGAGDDALLVVLDSPVDGMEATASVIPWDGTSWAFALARTVPLPGLTLRADDLVLPIAATIVESDVAASPWLRVAWRVGHPGTRIDMLELPWDEPADLPAPQTVLDLEAAVTQTVDWAELRRPWWVGKTLVTELWAPLDVETPRPGDLALLRVRLEGNPALVSPPQRLVLADALDIDAIGPALDLAAVETEDPPILSARLDQREAVILQVDPDDGSLRRIPTVTDGNVQPFTFLDGSVSSILGAFGSRMAAGFYRGDGDGRLRLAQIDDLGQGGIRSHSLSSAQIPEPAQITSELAVGVVDGVGVFLAPYGDTAPVQTVVTTSSSLRTQSHEPLMCDAVALPAVSRPSTEGGEPMPLPLACAFDGTVRVWMLQVATNEDAAEGT